MPGTSVSDPPLAAGRVPPCDPLSIAIDAIDWPNSRRFIEAPFLVARPFDSAPARAHVARRLCHSDGLDLHVVLPLVRGVAAALVTQAPGLRQRQTADLLEPAEALLDLEM